MSRSHDHSCDDWQAVPPTIAGSLLGALVAAADSLGWSVVPGSADGDGLALETSCGRTIRVAWLATDDRPEPLDGHPIFDTRPLARPVGPTLDLIEMMIAELEGG